MAGTTHTCSHHLSSEMLSVQKITCHASHTQTIDDRDIKFGWHVRGDVTNKVIWPGWKICHSFFLRILERNRHLVFAIPDMELVAPSTAHTKMDVSIFFDLAFFFYEFFSSFHKTPNNAFVWHPTRKRPLYELERVSWSMWSSIYTFLRITVTDLRHVLSFPKSDRL